MDGWRTKALQVGRGIKENKILYNMLKQGERTQRKLSKPLKEVRVGPVVCFSR